MKCEKSFYIVLYQLICVISVDCLICCRVALLGNTTLLGESELYVWINISDFTP